MNIHEKYIKRCIQLAENGLGSTYPNPLVGSVIVHKNRIIGEGWHQKAGDAHAEVNAINSVQDQELLKEATIYVSLEPCSHFGKTPPCSDLIIYRGIPKVVIGTMDPFAKVAGRGIKKLLEAGKEVQVGILEEECNALNKRFFTFHKKQRPYIILKWAQTRDLFLAPKTKDTNRPVWISNRYCKQLVHKWRSEESGILVGTGTARADNPRLDVRNWSGTPPVRLVIDRELKLSKDLALFDLSIKTIVLNEKITENKHENLVYQKIEFSENIAKEICRICYEQEIQSLIVEGGANILKQFITSNLWDEARVFTGDNYFSDGVKAPKLDKKPASTHQIETDLLEIFRNSDND